MNACMLIVDDEVEIRDMLSRHFRFLGFDVQTAGNGKEACDLLERAKIDVVISDIMMPVMDGIQLLRHLHQQYPMTHAIMITGYITLENALACMRLGAQTFIFKPLEDLTELEAAVDKSVEAIQHWFDLLEHLQTMKHKVSSGAEHD